MDKSNIERKINNAEKKIPDIIGLVEKTDYNVTITETGGKIHSTNGLATTATLTSVEDKILALII